MLVGDIPVMQQVDPCKQVADLPALYQGPRGGYLVPPRKHDHIFKLFLFTGEVECF